MKDCNQIQIVKLEDVFWRVVSCEKQILKDNSSLIQDNQVIEEQVLYNL